MGQPVDISTRIARLKANASLSLERTFGITPGGLTTDQYQRLLTNPLAMNKWALADEGSYFVATNPTPGTGVAYALVTAFSDTANGLFVLQNNNPAGGSGGGVNIALDYVKLMLTAAPTATQSLELTVRTDTVAMVPTANNVQIGGGAGAQTLVSTNHNDNTAPNVNLWAFNAGAMTVPASSASARRVGRIRIPTGLGIVGDEYEVQFGAVDRNSQVPGMTAVRASSPARFVAHAAPIILQPQMWAVITAWWLTAATSAPSFEYEIGMSVR